MKESKTIKFLRKQIRKTIMESFAPQLQETNVHDSYYGNYKTITNPIISDAFIAMENEGKWFYDKTEFEEFLNKQPYFSASFSKCFETLEDYENHNECVNCEMIFETGHELVAVWSELQGKGKVIPKIKKVNTPDELDEIFGLSKNEKEKSSLKKDIQKALIEINNISDTYPFRHTSESVKTGVHMIKNELIKTIPTLIKLIPEILDSGASMPFKIYGNKGTEYRAYTLNEISSIITKDENGNWTITIDSIKDGLKIKLKNYLDSIHQLSKKEVSKFDLEDF